MENINNKEKIDNLFKDLNFKADELKKLYNRYNSSLKFSEFLSYYDDILRRINIIYNYLKELEKRVEVKDDSYYHLKSRIDNLFDNVHSINRAIVTGSINDLKKYL